MILWMYLYGDVGGTGDVWLNATEGPVYCPSEDLSLLAFTPPSYYVNSKSLVTLTLTSKPGR